MMKILRRDGQVDLLTLKRWHHVFYWLGVNRFILILASLMIAGCASTSHKPEAKNDLPEGHLPANHQCGEAEKDEPCDQHLF